MPIQILAKVQPLFVFGRHEASALTGKLVTGRHYARGGFLGYAVGQHTAHARPAELVIGQHLAYARRVAGAKASSTPPPQPPPIEVITGVLPLTSRATTSLRQTLGVQYDDDGSGPNATITGYGELPEGQMLITVVSLGQRGQAGRSAGPTPALEPSKAQSYNISTRSVTIRLNVDGQYEKDDSTGLLTIRAHAENADKLSSVRLPELVPFMLKPTPKVPKDTLCSARPQPQRVAVSRVVSEALRKVNFTASFAPRSDPLMNAEWVEWSRPYSTAGKTAQQVLEETYYAIGWRGVQDHTNLDRPILHLLPPGGGISTPANLQSLDEVITGGHSRVVLAGLPKYFDMQGADLQDDLPTLTDLIQLAPDPTSYDREVRPEAIWYENSPAPDGTGEVVTSYFKTLGKITATSRVTTQDMTVSEQVDGQTVTKRFGRVLTAWETTELTYDPTCPDKLLRQKTVKKSWGYGVGTHVETVNVTAIAYMAALPAGDPLGDEEEIIEQDWNAEGWLAARTTRSRKLVSIKQEKSEDAPAERGKMSGHEYVTRVLTETFRPEGSGWLRFWQESGGQPIVLYDAESLDAVRMGYRGGTVGSGFERLDAAPTMVRCPDLCAKRMRAIPNVVRLKADKGRQGDIPSKSVNFTADRTELVGYAYNNMALSGLRTEYERSLIGVNDFKPGQSLQIMGTPYGIIQSVGFSVQGGSSRTTLNHSLLMPFVASPVPYSSDEKVHRDLVLFRTVGGVVVQHFTGELGEGNKPIYENVTVQVSGSQYPAPLDEIEWVDDPRFGPTATGNYGQEALGGES